MFFLSCSSSSLQSTFYFPTTTKHTILWPTRRPSPEPPAGAASKEPHAGPTTSCGTKGACQRWLEVAPDQNRRQPQPPPTTAPADRGQTAATKPPRPNHSGHREGTQPHLIPDRGGRARQLPPIPHPQNSSHQPTTLQSRGLPSVRGKNATNRECSAGESAETTCESPTD